MSDYFNNMHTYHISYAAYPSDYVRGRRYMPLAGQGLKGTKLAGEYNKVQMFENGNWLPVTVIKRAKEMWVEYTGVGKHCCVTSRMRINLASMRDVLGCG